MSFKDLREYLAVADELGELQVVEGAHWNLEIGCITELVSDQQGPILLFDKIPGYPAGFRVASNFLASPRRLALVMGFPPELSPMEMVRHWKEKSRSLKFIPPKVVERGPIMENQMEGEAVDLEKFPVPKWHEGDGGEGSNRGRYIGTADMVITKDPDSGWVNIGTYRGCIQGRNRLSLWMLGDRDARLIARKYWAKGEACPIAVVFGAEPTTWLAGPIKLPEGVSEYEYAGALRGAPVEVIRGPLTGLPIPAHAEIVVEGDMPPPEVESAWEGPFGEWTGYFTHTGYEPVVRVKRVMYRNDPIILGGAPLLPTKQRWGVPLFAARIWQQIENAAVTGVTGVWIHFSNLMMVVSLKQQYSGHAVQALLAAASPVGIGGMHRLFVAVDDDIDPTNLEQVMWAVCPRTDPTESVQIVRAMTTLIDPRVPPEKRERGELNIGWMLIDACKPFHWRDKFPVTNRFSDSMRAKVWEQWAKPMLAEWNQRAGKLRGA
jgi:UbiD family decarboxylase